VTAYDTADHRITGVSQHGDGGEGLLQTFRGTGSVWLAPTQDLSQRLQAGGFTTLASAPRSSNTDSAT
jgi:uncharacterized protein (AIM24 family)